MTEKQKAFHSFLKHYKDGKSIPIEEKPLDILKLAALTIYSIGFRKHRNFFDFYNSELCVDDFLRNIRYRYKAGSKKWFKCSLVIKNIQKPLYPGLQPIINSGYWSTAICKSIYFNDFIFFGLKQDILSRVIINSMSGSSLHFKRFISLAIKILDDATEGVI